ncbi:MAG: SDR family NAD(P)-dependent oxidoreductase, partial [Lachnospiraceae bacterium]|nr:SDR family NAD(P)-dependent oxidoreductase [Lachnospiraceae bacterium]
MENAREYALITGASSGIGREFARCLAKDGWNLLLVARRAERLQKLKDELKKTCPVDIRILPADLSFRAECGLVAREASKLPVKMLINNAGFGDFGDFTETELSREMQLIDVNVTAQHILTKKLLTQFEKQGKGGTILNVASSAGLLPGGPYMAS